MTKQHSQKISSDMLPCSLAFIGMLSCICSFVLWIYDIDPFERFTYLDREPLVPTHETQFNIFAKKISDTASTDIVVDTSANAIRLCRGKWCGGCIRGSGHWIYGSQDNYQDVLKR